MTYSPKDKLKKQEVYTLAKGWQTFIYVIAASLVLGSIAGLYLGLKDGGDILLLSLILTPIFLFLGIFIGLEMRNSKIIISSNSITSITTFTHKTLRLDDIKGFKIIDRENLIIFPKNKSFKKIKIGGFNYLKNSNLLIEWLHLHIIDLDEQENKSIKSRLLEDDNLGRNIEERKVKIAQAFKVTKWLKWIAVGVMLWTIFTHTFVIAIYTNLTFLIIILGTLFKYRGIIKFYNEKRESIHPGIDMGIIFPCFGIFLKSIGITLYDSNNVLVYMAISTVFLSVLLITATKEFIHRKWKDYFITFNILFIFCMYSYGMLTISNIVFDKSTPSKYVLNIKDKDIVYGKYSDTYKFITVDWGPLMQHQVEVSKNLYQQLKIGDTIVIYLKKGLFGSSWYIVKQS